MSEAPRLLHLNVETTTRCNLRCVHCYVSEENNLGAFPEIDLAGDLFDRALGLVRAHKPLVTLNGHGETFMNPRFLEWVARCREAGAEVEFQTNGTFLSEDTIETLLALDVGKIQVSIDGATREAFERVRRRASFDKIVANLRALKEAKRMRATDRPRLGFQFVAMRDNVGELPGVVRLAHELGAYHVLVVHVVEYTMTLGQNVAGAPEAERAFAAARAEAERLGVELALPFGSSADHPADEPAVPAAPPAGARKDCREPFESAFVSADGAVRPCCIIGEPYGHLGEEDFAAIWSGPRFGGLRTALESDRPYDVCVRCPLKGWRAKEEGA